MKSRSSKGRLSREDALSLLSESGCDERLKKHVLAVSRNAVSIASKIKSNGYDIDVGFVETAAILHDIGRCRTHGIRHGIEGADMLKEYPEYALVCERHIGAGIDRKEAVALGLPDKDYLPVTLEEKVIAHADNLVDGDRLIPIEDTISHLEGKLGKGHSAIERVIKLNVHINELLENAKEH